MVRCPKCSSSLKVPSATTTPANQGAAIPAQCECGKRFQAPLRLAGRQVRCPACQQPLTIPVPSRAAQPAASPQVSQPAVAEDLWDDLPAPGSQMRPSAPPAAAGDSPMGNANSQFAQQMLAKANREAVHREQEHDSWGTGKIVSGIGMMVGAVLWFGLGLLAGRIFCYPPVMFVMGVFALIAGIAQKFSR